MPKPISVLTDSKGGRDIVVNVGATKHTIHFDRRLYFLRDLVTRKMLVIELVGTDKMRADFMTKIVDRNKFEYCRRSCMNIPESAFRSNRE